MMKYTIAVAQLRNELSRLSYMLRIGMIHGFGYTRIDDIVEIRII